MLPAAILALLPPSFAALVPPQVAAATPEHGAFFWGDFDADGLLDACVLLEGGGARLLTNRGDGSLGDVTAEAGLAGVEGVHQAVWADFDGDGRLDLFLASWSGESRMLAQTSPGAFTALSDDTSLWTASRPLDVQVLDYDGDGRVDLHLVTEQGDRVLHNLGHGAFEHVELGFATVAPTIPEVGSTGDVDEARMRRGLPPLRPRARGEEASAAAGPAAAPTVGPPASAAATAICLSSVVDQASGTCLPASSVPTMGALYPLGNELFIDAGTGFVGVGTTLPQFPLDVAGDVHAAGQLVSDAVAGPPFVVASAEKVVDLNADRLDGLDSSAFASVPVGGAQLAAGAITDGHVASGAAIAGTKVAPDFGAQDVTTTGRVEAGELDVGRGTLNVPSIRFDPAEDTGLSSPSTDQLVLLSGGQPVLRAFPDGTLLADPSASSYSPNARVQVGISGGGAVGVDGSAFGGGAVALQGESNHVGVLGWQSSTSEVGYGAWGISSSPLGVGVVAENHGSGDGLLALAGPGGSAIVAVGDTAVSARTIDAFGEAVLAEGTTLFEFSDGLHGRAHHPAAWPVYGEHTGGGVAVQAIGDMAATGTKFFLQPHPEEAGQVVRFVCLEGDEAGTYFRGSSALAGGVAVIDVPEVFRFVTELDDLTVQVTPRGPALVWVESVDLDRVVVRGSDDVAFDYFVNGVRLGYRDVELVKESRAYRPVERGVPYGEHLPAEIRQLLVDNGTLNADLTPNEATAAALGWVLRDPSVELEERERIQRRRDLARSRAEDPRLVTRPRTAATQD